MAFTVVIPKIQGYIHTEAFREVAETVEFGLVALGERLATNGRQIILGPNLLRQEPPKGSILYNLEQVFPGSPWLTPEVVARFKRYTVWDYSKRNVEAWLEFGVRATLVPIGYVPELSRIILNAEPDFDVLFYGSINERRAKILNALISRGARVKAAFGIYGKERDALIAQSKIVLNIHFYESKVFEIVRVSYLLANRVAVVSETGSDHEENAFSQGIEFSTYENLVDSCISLIENERKLRDLRDRGFEIMQARSEATYLREAIRAR